MRGVNLHTVRARVDRLVEACRADATAITLEDLVAGVSRGADPPGQEVPLLVALVLQTTANDTLARLRA